ncbi:MULTISPECIES: TRAP transporter large permease [unclassified Thioclava]|uniref:TRAP transporter large permease n=1 Tax=unclassified Thioclava TaxID=2621713 RepID=UPI000997D166|nr:MULTISPECIES: TRAP transporter large permease [unclassified Thioclava]MAQ36052.1 TRAP transporter large permease [Thioclava sp.]MPQ95238.1 TRAP transporter large permease [Thioclava sp. JE_KL1]OOY06978.1 C4-dicarboxylate ABC transporter permease [Thioclava sp. F36-7]OOY15020.1 C4-dicarboxylate ABC transporter permease [Thioclava sp. DLFJ4-1]
MSSITIGLILIGVLFALVLLGMRIAVALLVVAFAGVWIIRGNFDLSMRLMSIAAYNGVANYLFATIPLFVLMGHLVSISNVGKDTFDVAEALLRRLLGGLGIATVAANTVFAAVTGVSIASAAVFTKVAVPEMTRHGYSPSFSAGTVAGSSVLGMLIPPSLLLIIYGVLAEQSIGRMFIAGLVPGALLATGFVLWILLAAKFAPGIVFASPKAQETDPEAQAYDDLSTGELLRKIVPIIVLVTFVLGGLYSGFFTPTEAGGVGAFAALIIAIFRRSLNLRGCWAVLSQTGTISVGILALLVAAGFYSQMLAVAGIPAAIGAFVSGSGFGPVGFLIVYVLLVLLLGMILDSSSILLIVVPIAAPIAQHLGYDLIQFGIITVIAVEVGLLTPPFGISIFTVHSTLGDRSVSLESIFAGALPYVGVMLGVLILVASFPVLIIG